MQRERDAISKSWLSKTRNEEQRKWLINEEIGKEGMSIEDQTACDWSILEG